MAMKRRSLARAISALTLALFATNTVAQSTTAAAASSGTSSAAIQTHTVAVAPADQAFKFVPDQIEANVSDIILFQFMTGNHSVARADYMHPCVPYEDIVLGAQGFWSGFEPVAGDGTNVPTFSLRVNTTEPVFFYCAAPDACIKQYMIGVINPNKTETFAAQNASIASASYQLVPGEAIPAESTPSPTSSTSSSTSSPTSTSTSTSSSSSGGISKGAIAGIVVGAVIVLCLAGLTFYLCGRNRTLASAVKYSHKPNEAPLNPAGTGPLSPSPASPYADQFGAPSPLFNQSPGNKPTMLANQHDSWQTASTNPQMAQVDGQYRTVSPAYPSPGHPSPGQAPWSPGGFGGQQYAPVPHQEMATEQEYNFGTSTGTPLHSPGFSHHDSYLSSQSQHPNTPAPQSPPLQHQQQYLQQQPYPQFQRQSPQVHEMDATVPQVAGSFSPPPEYVGRHFSFSEGEAAERPGVEKVLDGRER